MTSVFKFVAVCLIFELVAGATKSCCISKKWNGKMRITTAIVYPYSMIPVITVNSLMFDYDKDMMMERAQGSVRTENGTMVREDGYIVYNDYRHMRSYTIDISGKCQQQQLTEDQVSNCLPSTYMLGATFTLGSTTEGVMVNSWFGYDDNMSGGFLTTVNDCTPVSSTRFGTLPDGTKISQDTVFADVHQYMTSPDAFKLPPECNDDAVIPVGK